MNAQSPSGIYAAERPLDELRTPELLVVAVLRLWAAPLREPDRRHPHWHNGLLAADVGEDGLMAFDRLMRVVLGAARQPLDVRCARCPRLGEDEARLLGTVGLLQQGRHAEAGVILDQWLPPAAVRLALPPAVGLAMALADAGLTLTGHPPATLSPAPGVVVPQADRGMRLTH